MILIVCVYIYFMQRIDRRTFNLWEGYDKGTTTINDYSYKVKINSWLYDDFIKEKEEGIERKIFK